MNRESPPAGFTGLSSGRPPGEPGRGPEDALLGFISLLRKSGVRISLSETLDALEAVSFAGYDDRDTLRYALAAALAKSPDEEALFQLCFDRYFSRLTVFPPAGAVKTGTPGSGVEGLSPLSRMLLEGDGGVLARRLQETARSLSLDGARYPVNEAVVVRRILSGLGMEGLDGDITMLSMAGSPLSGSVATGLKESREQLVAFTRDYVKTILQFAGKSPAEDLNRYRSVGLTRLDEREIETLKAVVRRIVRRLNDIYWRRRRGWSRGRLDFRKTQRRSIPYGGIPFDVSWKRKKKDRADMMVLCDISQSVRTVVRFFLLFLYSLNEELVRIRTFVFCSNLVEASDIFERCSPEEAVDRIQSGQDLDIRLSRTDYGQAFRDFKACALGAVTRKTTVIILGDGRSNFYDPEPGILREIHDRAKRLIWLNPETRPFWGTGDSAMKAYLSSCSLVRECNTLGHLEGIVHTLLKI